MWRWIIILMLGNWDTATRIVEFILTGRICTTRCEGDVINADVASVAIANDAFHHHLNRQSSAEVTVM
jgi:hypothetical protein